MDTGLPKGTPEESPDETTAIFTGHDVLPYMDALAELGYTPDQVSKILLTFEDMKAYLIDEDADLQETNQDLELIEMIGLANWLMLKLNGSETAAE